MNTNEQQSLSFEFNGKGKEYFKIWIVNLVLSIVTLGIYSAWAKVRTHRYFYGNTQLDSSRFAYLAEPIQILKGRLISVFLFGLYYVAWQMNPELGFAFLALGCLLFPFFIVSAMSFRMRNSAYRNMRFKFVKDIKGAYAVFLLPLTCLIGFTWLLYMLADSLGLLEYLMGSIEDEPIVKEDFISTIFIFVLLPIFPWLDFLRSRFVINHIQYGEAEAVFSAKVWDFFKVYLQVMAWFAIIFTVVVGGGALGANLLDETQTGSMINESISVLLMVFMILFYLVLFFISGIWRAKRTNMINAHTRFGDNQLSSHLKGMKIGWLYLSNTIAIVFSVGLLIPWAQIRLQRYIITSTQIHIEDLASIRAIAQDETSSFGEEMGEAFDMELGF